ncbi:hypothetical protein, partial [Burkholderia cenocepacia]|uniref:hypothetical protein n=1 Tax=Burkholderia cenocepacia TaxID=95486 RepID=UPI001B913648
TGGHRLAGANPWIGTTICTGNSPKADHELRLKPDHPMGSGHKSPTRFGIVLSAVMQGMRGALRAGVTASIGLER